MSSLGVFIFATLFIWIIYPYGISVFDKNKMSTIEYIAYRISGSITGGVIAILLFA